MTIAGGTDVGALAGAPPRPVRQRNVDPLPRVVTGVGLLVLVTGTFLPWLRSGTAERNSYSADGALRTLLSLHGTSGSVLRAWPFVSLLCALAIGLLLVQLTRTGLTLAALSALAAGTVCIGVLHTRSNSMIGVATLGPAVALIGCVLTLAGVVLAAAPVLLRAAPSHRSRRPR